MNSDSPSDFRRLTATHAEAIDGICDRFEAAWNTAEAPLPDSFLDGHLSEYRFLLAKELARIEVGIYARRKQPIDFATLQTRYKILDEEWLDNLLSQSLDCHRRSQSFSAAPQLPDYEVLQEIGRGGMGVAFRGRDLRLGRLVCLKVLHVEQKHSSKSLSRLRREARTIGAMNHPNLCTLYDVQEVDGSPCLILEWIEGATLRDACRGENDFDKLLSTFGQIASAMDAAHRAGVVHRDLKPENVMIRHDGLVKVLDFGLARLEEIESSTVDHSLSETAEGVILGTAKYMSPEQARGEKATSASDIFSLGIMLYEVASGRHPFPGEVIPTILHSIITQDPTPLNELEPNLPLDVCELVQHMLCKFPAGRPTAAEVVECLTKIKHSANPTLFHWQSIDSSNDSPLLVGRSEETLMMHQACEAVAAGRGSYLCFSGEPGIGKTTLVEAYIEQMTSRHLIFTATARCSQRLANGDDYLPILDAIEDLCTHPENEVVRSLLKSTAPSWYNLIASINDTLASTVTLSNSPSRMKREFRAFIAELAKTRPVVLFIDDVHWLDESSVELLAYLGSEIQALRCLVLATYRPTELVLSKHPFCRLRLDLQSAGKLRDICLGLLSEDDVVQLLAQRYPSHDFPPHFAKALYHRTEGSPLFLVEFLKYLESQNKIIERDGRSLLRESLPTLGGELPDSISSLIDRKLGYLDEQGRRILQLASVQGYTFDSVVIASAGKWDRLEVEDRLHEFASVHGLISYTGERKLADGMLTADYRFVHVLHHLSLEKSILPSRRAAWRAAVTCVLETLYGSSSTHIAVEPQLANETLQDVPQAQQWLDVSVRPASTPLANHEIAGNA